MAKLDGQPITIDQLAALVLVPYGHFTSMRVDNHRVRGLSLHLERLSRDCRVLYNVDLDLNNVRAYLRQAITDLSGSIMVRVTIFDPELDLAHPGAAATPHILVTTRPAPVLPLTPLRLQSAQYCREDPAIKHIGLYGSLHLRRIAQQSGFDDVLFVDAAGKVSEGATWNLGLFDGEHVIWPQSEVLAGITMRLLADAHGGSATTPFHLHDLPNMEAVFATNTAIQVRPIAAIDEAKWSTDHPIIKQLQDEYSEITPEAV